MTRSLQVRQVQYGHEQRFGAMPAARATHASHRALLRSLGHSVSIAIAVFAASWFAASLVSAAGQL